MTVSTQNGVNTNPCGGRGPFGLICDLGSGHAGPHAQQVGASEAWEAMTWARTWASDRQLEQLEAGAREQDRIQRKADDIGAMIRDAVAQRDRIVAGAIRAKVHDPLGLLELAKTLDGFAAENGS